MSLNFQDRLNAARSSIKQNHVAKSTAKVYGRIEERFKKYLETVPSEAPEVDKVLVFLNENFNKSPEGFRAATAALRAFYVLKGTIQNPLDAEVIKLAGKAVARQAPATQHKVKLQAGQFSDAMLHLSQSPGDKPKRMQALLMLSAGAYLRPGEALALQSADVIQQGEHLKVTIRKDKTNQNGLPRHAWIRDGPQIAPILSWRQRVEELNASWLFPNLNNPAKPWSYDAAAKEVRELRADGKLPPGMTLHSLRGTAATRATVDGATPEEIARAGRWSGTQTLTKCYIEPSPDNISRATNVLATLMAPAEATTSTSGNTVSISAPDTTQQPSATANHASLPEPAPKRRKLN